MENEIKVNELLKLYNSRLFDYLSIEFRDKDNFMIKKVKYGCFQDYLENENFKDKKVKEFFAKENEIVILIDEE